MPPGVRRSSVFEISTLPKFTWVYYTNVRHLWQIGQKNGDFFTFLLLDIHNI